jgi:hypothetical protein
MCWTSAAAVGITWCLAHRQVGEGFDAARPADGSRVDNACAANCRCAEQFYTGTVCGHK